jgi:hypothetical protein
MSDDQEMAEVAVFNTDIYAKVPLGDLRFVSPYIWYFAAGKPMTVIETPEGGRAISMSNLINSYNPELGLSPEDFGLPPGTSLCPPEPWLPDFGHILLGVNERGGPVTATVSNVPPPPVSAQVTSQANATLSLITEVLPEVEG